MEKCQNDSGWTFHDKYSLCSHTTSERRQYFTPKWILLFIIVQLSFSIKAMTAKMNMVLKSYIVSFLLILIILTTQVIDIPFENIVIISVISILLILSALQLFEFARIRKLLIRTSDILSQGNERDFSVLQEKEKNIINYKITNLIEQLEDSVKQSNTILDEKEKLASEVETYRSSIENIQNSLDKDVIDIKNQMSSYADVIDNILSDFSLLQDSYASEDEMLRNLLEVYNSYEMSYETIKQSIEQTRNISDREIGRSEQLIESLSGLYDQSENNDEQLSVIFKGIDNIRDVTDIINEVAEKASILSLNAAIESAHAGEAGKGFAVVAEEVGVLATSTAEHADNINEALYTVSDLINENKQDDDKEINSYRNLIKDVQAINESFEKIKELLNFISFLKKPEVINVKEIRTKDKNILSENFKILTTMKSEIENSLEEIGKLVILKTKSSQKTEHDSRLHIHETSLKPIDSETPLDL